MATISPASLPPIVSSIEPLSSDKKAWICDIWGVMHNGVTSFPSAWDACCKFRESGGTVLLLTNAPRPAGPVTVQLEQLGVPDTAYDVILTSGDMTRTLIERRLPAPLFHLGPPRDKPLFAGFDAKFEGSMDAEFVVCTGLFNDEKETPANYEEVLGIFKSRNLPMICANPDIKVERGERVIYCAGALAERYRELGGEVIYAGKPHLPVYERAMELISEKRGETLAKSDVLAIGDGVHTDIAGAINCGVDVVFIASRIHVDGSLDDQALAGLFPADKPTPVAAMTALAW